ncbi:hypothetical protein CISIN_1g0286612mg, partial [Citrus sinensis]
AIELSILADYYGSEIAAYDIQTTRCDLYGQVSSFLESFVHEILASSALLNVPFSSVLISRKRSILKELCSSMTSFIMML